MLAGGIKLVFQSKEDQQLLFPSHDELARDVLLKDKVFGNVVHVWKQFDLPLEVFPCNIFH